MQDFRQYDVCLSFAGEDRPFVQDVATHLFAASVRVFYDRHESAELWGKDLYQHFAEIYSKHARYCVVFISAAYADKLWARHELRSAQARAFTENREYILPARFDLTELPGIPATVGYIDLTKYSPDEFASLIIEKLRLRRQGGPVETAPSRRLKAKALETPRVPDNMRGCELWVAGSAQFDVDAYLLSAPFKADRVLREDVRWWFGAINAPSVGFHVKISKATYDDVLRQTQDALAFLTQHESAIRGLVATPSVERVSLIIFVGRRSEPIRYDRIPPSLVLVLAT